MMNIPVIKRFTRLLRTAAHFGIYRLARRALRPLFRSVAKRASSNVRLPSVTRKILLPNFGIPRLKAIDGGAIPIRTPLLDWDTLAIWNHDSLEYVENNIRVSSMFVHDPTLAWLEDPRLSCEGQRRLIDAISATKAHLDDQYWDPYTVSTRLLTLCRIVSDDGYRDDASAAALVARHASFLFHTLEWERDGSHLWRNACALITAGGILNCRDSATWIKHGSFVLNKCLERQLLSDGGHIERSPYYHVTCVGDLLTAICVRPSGIEAASWKESLVRMLTWADQLRGPHKTLPLFNDTYQTADYLADFLIDYSQQRGMFIYPGNWSTDLADLAETGYFRVEASDFTLTVDLAPPGARDYPAVVHADVFTFELRHRGEPLVVDYGVPAYDGPQRTYARSWQGHNTLSIDGESCCEVWGSYMVGRWTTPVRTGRTGDHTRGTLSAAHSGFDWLSGSPVHERSITWQSEPVEIRFRDRVDGRGIHQIVRQIRIASEDVTWVSSNILRVPLSGCTLYIESDSPWDLTPSEWWPSPYLSRQSVLATTTIRTQLPWTGEMSLRVVNFTPDEAAASG